MRRAMRSLAERARLLMRHSSLLGSTALRSTSSKLGAAPSAIGRWRDGRAACWLRVVKNRFTTRSSSEWKDTTAKIPLVSAVTQPRQARWQARQVRGSHKSAKLENCVLRDRSAQAFSPA